MDNNKFFCYGCKTWRLYQDWIAKRWLTDAEANYCKNCVKIPTEEELGNFNQLINELKNG